MFSIDPTLPRYMNAIAIEVQQTVNMFLEYKGADSMVMDNGILLMKEDLTPYSNDQNIPGTTNRPPRKKD